MDLEHQEEWHRQDQKDMILGFISSMSKCGSDQMAAVLSPDVVWTIPGTSLVSGPAEGISGVLQRCQMIHKYNARLDFRQMLYGPYANYAMAELRNTGVRQIGQVGNQGVIKFDEHVMMLFTFAPDGKIQTITNFISDLDNLNTYFQ